MQLRKKQSVLCFITVKLWRTECPRNLDQIYIVSKDVNWDKTSWACIKNLYSEKCKLVNVVHICYTRSVLPLYGIYYIIS